MVGCLGVCSANCRAQFGLACYIFVVTVGEARVGEIMCVLERISYWLAVVGPVQIE